MAVLKILLLLVLLKSMILIAKPRLILKKPPKYVVPNPNSRQGAAAFRALKVLAPCHVRILSWIPFKKEDGIMDPVDGDVIHFAATLYNEVGAAYSVLRLQRDWAEAENHPNLLKINSENGATGFPHFIHRYNFKANLGVRPISKTSRCSALLSVSDPLEAYLPLSLDRVAATFIPAEVLWGLNGPSTAVMFLDSPRDGSRPAFAEPMTSPAESWTYNQRSYRWNFICALRSWTRLTCLIGSHVDQSKSEIRFKEHERMQAPMGDFEGGIVLWSQLFKTNFKSDDVLLGKALPLVCQHLNATLAPERDYSTLDLIIHLPEITINIVDLGSLTLGNLTDDAVKAWEPMRFTETYPQVSFLFIGEPQSRKLSALIDPMDTGTWIWTLISLLAVSILTASITEVKLSESVFAIALTLLGQGDVPPTEKGHVRTVLALWLLATIVIVGGYTGLLFTMLTSPVAPWWPETFQELNDVYTGDIVSSATTILNKDAIMSREEQQEQALVFERAELGFSEIEVWYQNVLRYGTEVAKKLAVKHGLGRFIKRVKSVASEAQAIHFVVPQLYRSRLRPSRAFDLRDGLVREDGVKTPETYVHVSYELDLILYQLLLEAVGLQKILKRGNEVIPMLSRVSRWIGQRSSAKVEIEGGIQQLAEGGFLSAWAKVARSQEAILQLKWLQLEVSARLKMRGQKKGLELTPMLANFISKRNLMVHYFNDFSSSTSVYLQTVDWSVRRLAVVVLVYVFELCAWLVGAAGALLVMEFVVASIHWINR